MRKYYVVSYLQYPIFEPAEGGYYYEGAEIDWYTPVKSLKKARKLLKRAVREFYEAEGSYTEEVAEAIKDTTNHFYHSTRYIGDGVEWHIETKLGIHEHGYKPYC